MGEFSDHVVHLAARKAAEQGGVISGANPSAYNASDPFPLWVIQAIIIIAMSQFLSIFFNRMRQPRVIAEVIGGILLGPSVFGRIPGFQNAVFPPASLPNLNLTSTIGLILFLFLVGLEIDTKIIRRNAFAATTISIAGLIIPLGLGAALGVAIYKEFASPATNFGYFLLFTAVAVGITAFPVLCRILSALKLLDTTVGVVTLAAGVGNDVVGWILLALTVALVNASNGLTALYVLLAATGFVIFFMYPVRWAYYWTAKHSGSLEQGSPTAGMMTITLILVLTASFFTDIIGIHAVFGGFLAGLIIPHDNGYAIAMVEKLEDIVTLLLLPIYFALSGLRTNLGSMDSGKAWGYTALLCLVSFSSKFISCFATATANGFNWRESGAIGSLMSCKGLVELIVLNIGLQAGILDTRTFSMFVVHAVILTFITTPLTLLFYPHQYHTRQGSRHLAETGTGPTSSDDETKTRFTVVLDKIEQLPAAMTISQLLHTHHNASSRASILPSIDEKSERPAVTPHHSSISIHALRLIELTSRTSAVLKSQVAETLANTDPVIAVYKTFGFLNRLVVSATLSVVGHDEFTSAISRHVEDCRSQMVILPWSRAAPSGEDGTNHSGNPFDGTSHKTAATQNQTGAVVYSEFIRRVFALASTNVALFVDSGHTAPYAESSRVSATQHLFLPFFGGPDDRLALSFVVQLCRNSTVQATVIRIQKNDELTPSTSRDDGKESEPSNTPLPVILPQSIAAADTVYGQHNTETRLASESADNIIWSRYTASRASFDSETASALSRIAFSTRASAKPLHALMKLVPKENEQTTSVIVVSGRSRRLAVASHKAELGEIISESGSSLGSSVPKTLGDVGAALIATRTPASLLIMQAHTT